MSQRYTHEDFSRNQAVEMGSERGFAIVFAMVFLATSIWLYYQKQELWSYGLAGLAGCFTLLAFTIPKVLRPLNALWFQFGMMLHKIINPIVLGLVFFAVLTPVAILMRLFGKTPLPLAPNPEAETYWIPRDPPGPDPKSMKRQF